jgi:hypothetical protein
MGWRPPWPRCTCAVRRFASCSPKVAGSGSPHTTRHSTWNCPPRSSLRARPLTDAEVALCRSYSITSLMESRQPAAWALAEATARSAEVARCHILDLDLDRARVWLHGGSKTEPRRGQYRRGEAADRAAPSRAQRSCTRFLVDGGFAVTHPADGLPVVVGRRI